MWRLLVCLAFLWWSGCASLPQGMTRNQSPTVARQEAPTTQSSPVLSPVTNKPVQQAPQAEQQGQGWLNWLSQKTTTGIDPLWFLTFMALQTWLSHRREVARIRRDRKP